MGFRRTGNSNESSLGKNSMTSCSSSTSARMERQAWNQIRSLTTHRSLVLQPTLSLHRSDWSIRDSWKQPAYSVGSDLQYFNNHHPRQGKRDPKKERRRKGTQQRRTTTNNDAHFLSAAATVPPAAVKASESSLVLWHCPTTSTQQLLRIIIIIIFVFTGSELES